jgi:hypothetical protein
MRGYLKPEEVGKSFRIKHITCGSLHGAVHIAEFQRRLRGAGSCFTYSK